MGWSGSERRGEELPFNGLERRSDVRARMLFQATRLADVEVRALADRRRMEEADAWDTAEYLE
ncbi:MAG TPA: hypothetical protein VFM16_01170 [Holophagaceae bacterium]|nr:hypothetical protein [Holophagaceae bacterium]